MGNIRYTTGDDIVLLRQVKSLNPFNDSNQWKSVSENVIRETRKNFTLRSIREHLHYVLLKNFLCSQTSKRKRYGTSKEVDELQRLLQDVYDLKNAATSSTGPDENMLSAQSTSSARSTSRRRLRSSSSAENTSPPGITLPAETGNMLPTASSSVASSLPSHGSLLTSEPSSSAENTSPPGITLPAETGNMLPTASSSAASSLPSHGSLLTSEPSASNDLPSHTEGPSVSDDPLNLCLARQTSPVDHRGVDLKFHNALNVTFDCAPYKCKMKEAELHNENIRLKLQEKQLEFEKKKFEAKNKLKDKQMKFLFKMIDKVLQDPK